jgi:hypothetical protein
MTTDKLLEWVSSKKLDKMVEEILKYMNGIGGLKLLNNASPEDNLKKEKDGKKIKKILCQEYCSFK